MKTATVIISAPKHSMNESDCLLDVLNAKFHSNFVPLQTSLQFLLHTCSDLDVIPYSYCSDKRTSQATFRIGVVCTVLILRVRT
jgi:hypothetical protein